MVTAAVLTAALSAFAMVLVVERRAVAYGLIDLPNERSSHVDARPRGGGLGVIVGVLAGLLVARLGGWPIDASMWSVLAGALVVAAAGLRDDVASLGAAPRLMAQTAAAVFVVAICGGLQVLPLPAPFDISLGWLGPVCTVLWIVGVTNFFNFMDGADGLAAGQACLTFLALALVLWPSPAALVPLLAAAAAAAFLLRNWSPARIFLGDVGSGWLGFVLAAWPLLGPVARRDDLVRLVAVSLGLFLIDPTVTLLRRWWSGARITASHREHAYQRLFRPAQPHAVVVGLLLAAAGVLTMAAVVGYYEPSTAWWSLGLATVLAAAEFLAAARVQRRVRSTSRSG